MRKEILLLGEPVLYEKSAEVTDADWPTVPGIIADLHDTLLAFRKEYGSGRAIAAPQIGVPKRIIYTLTDEPATFVNPVLSFPDDELMEVWDDCMSFPGLFVKVKRRKRCTVQYLDAHRRKCEISLEGDPAELIQHEYDHLNGILATMLAIDGKSFSAKAVRRHNDP